MLRFFAVAAILCAATAANAQCEVAKLTQPNAPEDGNFGATVGISGDVIVVGAGQAAGDPTPGAAYVYRRVGGDWIEEQRLEPSDGQPGDGAGSVAISGNVIVVGAWMHDAGVADSGAAYVFRHDGDEWVEEQKLTAPVPTTDDQFGILVSIDADVIAVAASGDDTGGVDAGAVHVFRFDGATWNHEAELIADAPQAGAFLGYPVAVDGDRVIAGAYLTQNDDGGFGAAFVFEFDGNAWGQMAKLEAMPGVASDTYGLSCDIEGDLAVVGALSDSEDEVFAGAAYVYRYDGSDWVQEEKLLGSLPDDESFGSDVSIANGMVLVTSTLADVGGVIDAGRAYVFRRQGNQWIEAASFHASDPGEEDWFASTLAWRGDVAIIGSRLDDAPGEDAGSAYVFDVFDTLGLSGDCNANGLNDLIDIFINGTSADCNDNGIPDECDIAMGTSMDADANGVPDECQACLADVNGDGVLNILDFVAFQGLFLQGCPF